MEEVFKVDTNSKMPIYQQIYCHIKELIEKGIYKVGSIIPSESEMQEMFSVSRITVRRAISDLEHDGYLCKRRGAGTMVLQPKTDADVTSFNSFGGYARVQGEVPGSIVLQCKKVESTVKVSNMLHINFGESVYFLKRLRLINGRLTALHETYVTGRLGFSLSEDDFDSTTSLYDFLEEHGIELGSAVETTEARMPSSEIRKALFMPEGHPTIYKERVTYDVNGMPIEFSECHYIGDLYRYKVKIVNVRDKSEKGE